MLTVIGPRKECATFPQQLLFPIAYLGRMQVVLSRDLADRFGPLDRFQSDFELKVIAVLLSFFGQFFPPQALMFLPYSILARGPVFRVNYKLRGRVVSVYTLSFFGLMPLGALLAGFVAEFIGEPLTIILSALISLGFGLVLYVRVPALRQLE